MIGGSSAAGGPGSSAGGEGSSAAGGEGSSGGFSAIGDGVTGSLVAGGAPVGGASVGAVDGSLVVAGRKLSIAGADGSLGAEGSSEDWEVGVLLGVGRTTGKGADKLDEYCVVC